MYYVLFVFAMLTPVLMAVVGLIWRIHPPKRDGGFLAYRTALSSKTEETWAFAHRHISKLWLRIGLLLSILSAVLMVVFRESASSFVPVSYTHLDVYKRQVRLPDPGRRRSGLSADPAGWSQGSI